MGGRRLHAGRVGPLVARATIHVVTAGAAPADGDGGDGCAACGSPTRPRPGGTQLVGGQRLVREIGSCLRCGLQLVRFQGEAWREIRG